MARLLPCRPDILFVSLIFLLFPLTSPCAVSSTVAPDTVNRIVIGSITIKGNTHTRPAIILRELNFREGDTLDMGILQGLLKTSRENVFNTRLFTIVSIDSSLNQRAGKVNMTISVIERWYIWPIPFFAFSDRNFNVWWETRDFSRLTFGADVAFFNMRGRNETLTLLTHFGYNQLYGFTYKTPYINKSQTIGLGFGAGLELNHEVAVETFNNIPVYKKDPSRYLKQLTYTFVNFIFRPSYYTLHTFGIEYDYLYFADSVKNVNGFVLNGSNAQKLIYLSYVFKSDHRDVQYYPLTGYYLDAGLFLCMPAKTTRSSFFKTTYSRYWRIFSRWYWASGATAKISFANNQPYFLQRGLGYDKDYVRGYEYYVVDGQHYLLLKDNLKFAIIPERVIRLDFIRTRKFNTIPLALYLNLFCDLGYVLNNNTLLDETRGQANNTLENKLLVGYGAGLDFVTYYDFVVRMEVSLNQLGKPGLYLHFIAPI